MGRKKSLTNRQGIISFVVVYLHHLHFSLSLSLFSPLSENAEVVLATEMMIACQAIDFLRPARTTEPLEAIHARIRRDIAHWDQVSHVPSLLKI